MKSFVFVAIAALAVAGCGQTEPRSTQYFEAHIDEARKIVDGCRDGSVRGDECGNADIAVRAADAKDRRQKFFGTGKYRKKD